MKTNPCSLKRAAKFFTLILSLSGILFLYTNCSNQAFQSQISTDFDSLSDPSEPPPVDPKAKIIFSDNFENPNLAGWGASGNDTAFVTNDEKLTGKSAVQMKVGPSDLVVYRTEIVLKNSLGDLLENINYCIKFAFKIKNWSNFPKWVTFLQTHAIPYKNDFSCSAGRNSISLTSNTNKTLNLAVVDKPVIKPDAGAIATSVYSEGISLDKWYDVKMRFRPSFDKTGIIEVWFDGKKVYSQVNAANMDPYDQCGRPSEPWVHLKLGLYKERTDVGTQNIYYDDFSLAESEDCK